MQKRQKWAAELIDDINTVLFGNNVSIVGDKQEFEDAIISYSIKYRFLISSFNKSIGSFTLSDHKKTLNKISRESKSILGYFEQMHEFGLPLLLHQLKTVQPEAGLHEAHKLDQFRDELDLVTKSIDAIVKTMGPLASGSPVKKHLIRFHKFEYTQFIASVCMEYLDETPTTGRDKYFCELMSYCLEIITQEASPDPYPIVQEVFRVTQLPNPKYG